MMSNVNHTPFDRPDCKYYHGHLELVVRGKAIALSTGDWKPRHSVCPANCRDYVRSENNASPWRDSTLGGVV